MTNVKGGLFILVLLLGVNANAESSRKFGLFGGFGFSRAFARVQQPGVETTLAGWGNTAEVGVDVPFSGSFGMIVGAEVGESDLRNTYKSDTYLDQTTIKSKGLRAGFFYKNLSLGYGTRTVAVDLKAISSTTGASVAHLEGSGSYAYGAFSIDHREMLRGTLELQANTMELNSFSYTDYTIGLKASLLINGLLD
ncbi:MAG: hypothetical protein V4760_13460 [Bdellovibrionota bacterium]